MKCVCGFDNKIDNENKNFYFLFVQNLVLRSLDLKIEFGIDTIYVCPECGTLKINLDRIK